MSAFLRCDLLSVMNNFLECNLDVECECSFEGIPMPPKGFDTQARRLVGMLMKAGAHPQQLQSYYLVQALRLEQQPYIDMVMEHGLVQHFGDHCYKLAMKGLKCIRVHQKCSSFRKIASPRPDLVLEDATTWEVMMMLSNLGWHGEPMPRKLPKAIPTTGGIPDGEQMWFLIQRNLMSVVFTCCASTSDGN